MKVSHLRRFQLALLFFATACGEQEPAQHSERFPAVLADRWVRVYPLAGAPDTVTLLANGRVAGSVTALQEPHVPITHWQIGHPNMPGGFCIGNHNPPLVGELILPDTGLVSLRKEVSCQGFALVGDTLALAQGAVLIRASAARDIQQLLQRFSRPGAPRITPPSPRPGDTVRGIK